MALHTAPIAKASASIEVERAGWEVLTVSELTSHSLMPRTIHLRALAEFRPDVAFVPDHLRHEFGASLPPGLVHVAWVQDRLPNLLSTKAAEHLRSSLGV